MSAPLLTLDGLRARFARQPESLIEVADDIAARFVAFGSAFASAGLGGAARDLLSRCPDPAGLPLWGMPYVVGANIDVAGLPTSAGLPALDFQPDFDAAVVERLQAAGALLVGKALVDPLGLDAAATGAAATIAAGLAVFGIASDRTGAACADAVINEVVAIKPTPGCISIEGLFAVAPELDGIVILAADVAGGTAVRQTVECIAAPDPCRTNRVLGLLGEMSTAACAIVDRLGLATVAVNDAPFAEIGTLMEDDVWLALRLDDIAAVFVEMPELFPPHLRRRLSVAHGGSSRDLLRLQRRLASFRQRIEAAFVDFDLLFVPPETNLIGFVNACGLAAITLPEGGTLVGVGGSDGRLADAAALFAAAELSRSTRPIDILASSPLAQR